jgi:hypothetical protein
MTDEVVTLIREGSSFKAAFATIAHKHNIWHHKEKAQYNYFFSQVMERVKKKIGREALSQACKKQISSAPLHQTRERRPDFKQLAAHDID